MSFLRTTPRTQSRAENWGRPLTSTSSAYSNSHGSSLKSLLTLMDRLDIWPDSGEPGEDDWSSFIWKEPSSRQSTSETTPLRPSTPPFSQNSTRPVMNWPLSTTHNSVSGNLLVDPNSLFYRSQGLIPPVQLPQHFDPHISSLLPAAADQLGDAIMDVRHAAALSLPATKPRKPTAENKIAPSPFRPHVAAVQRILMWTTPHSILAQERRDGEVSRRLQTMMLADLLVSTTHDTRQAYGAGLLRFNQFCDRELIPESRRMPASDILLGAFIADHTGKLLGKAIRNWLNGLRLWHIYNDADWHGKEGWLPGIIKAADKKGAAFKRLPRGPVTTDHLRELRARLDIIQPRDAAIWAVALAAFWGCRRLGELLIKSVSKFSLEHDVTRSTRLSRLMVNSRVVISFHLPWTKTTGIIGGDAILTATDDGLCPVRALENHFSVNHSPDRDTPMFSFRNGSNWSHLLKHQFLDLTDAVFNLKI
ncbi:hypothetical protein B0H14DRAFT_450818 [Mycena olivaceomarginata]|nr:hypothetical protein B0H14DRAFT_450818 [Mycena olivaceomarginata]